MTLDIKCSQCGFEYPKDGLPYLCPICGGIFKLGDVLDFRVNQIDSSKPGLWKYWHSFGLKSYPEIIYMGEGDTPLVWDSVNYGRLGYKLENLNPTGSYKDRGTCVLVSHLAERGLYKVVEDSSGNAGASLAGYAARIALRAKIFIPEAASGPKREQISRFGASVFPVAGPRSEAARLVRQDADDGIPYASHAYIPFGLAGIATIAYELVQQTGGHIGTVIAPVGHGGLLLGLLHGFKALIAAGIIKKYPKMIGVQAANCNPVERQFIGNSYTLKDIQSPTIAEGIRVIEPVRSREIIEFLRRIDGKIISIAEENIFESRDMLAKRGIDVEPTSAVCWSAYQQLKSEIIDPVILILTGAGTKFSSR